MRVLAELPTSAQAMRQTCRNSDSVVSPYHWVKQMYQLGELLKDSAALPVNHPKKLVSGNGMASGSLTAERQCPLTGYGLSNSNS